MNQNQRTIASYVHNEHEIHKQYRYPFVDFEYGLVGFGYHKTMPGYSYGPLKRDFAIIHFVVSGRGKTVVNHTEYDIGPNQCFLFRPNQLHYYEASQDDPWEYYYFSFCGTQVDAILQEMGFGEDTVIRKIPEPEELIRLLRTLSETIDDPIAYYRQQGLLCLLIHQFIMFSVQERKPVLLMDREFRTGLFSTDNYASLAKGIIHNYYFKPIDARYIAAQLNLSSGYLNVLFKRETNKTLHSYLTEYRLMKAKELLASTPKTVKEIAREVGFDDPFYFSRIFVKYFSLSPSQYRLLNRKNKKSETTVMQRKENPV